MAVLHDSNVHFSAVINVQIKDAGLLPFTIVVKNTKVMSDSAWLIIPSKLSCNFSVTAVPRRVASFDSTSMSNVSCKYYI